jgi:predicted nuclease of predicted toxin-antitoxin system
LSELGFGKSFDREIWDYARQNDYMIVTKDADFSELSLLLNFPPKIIWIRRGNCSTNDIEKILRGNYEAIVTLSDDPDQGILTLF